MKTFTTTIIDTDDGTGDGILQLPEDLCKEDDWQEGDQISINVDGESIVLRNISKEQRENLSR